MYHFEVADVRFTNELVDFWRESFLAAYEKIHSRENIEAYFGECYTIEKARSVLSDQDFFCLIAIREIKTVGIAIIHHQLCPLNLSLNASELKHLYLLPSEYGSGLAKEMLEKVFAIAAEEGRKQVWLSVSKKNLRAQNFYKKNQFEVLGDGEDIHVGGETLPSQIMLRKL